MIREIVESAENTYTLNFPNELIGKKVEVIAFEIEEESHKTPVKKSIEQLNKELEGLTISLNGFKFNRDEANDYH